MTIVAPKTPIVRELDVGGEVLVTIVLCAKTMPKLALEQLYKRRWEVELNLRDIRP